MYASRFVIGAVALSLLVAGFGCTTGKSGKIPVASPMVVFAPPEREDVFPDEDTSTEEEPASAEAAGDGE